MSDDAPAIGDIAALAIDCAEPQKLARWWAQLLGGTVEVEQDGDATLHTLRAPGGMAGRNLRRRGPQLSSSGGVECHR